MVNIFNIPPEWRGDKPKSRVNKPKEDLRADIQALINRINELKLEIDRFVKTKGRKAKELYPMLIEDMNDAARELKDVIETINKLAITG